MCNKIPLTIIQGSDLVEPPDNSLFVVVDTLRGSTTLTALMTSRPKAVYVVTEVEEAFDLATKLDSCLLVGERGGIKVSGFDYGNSPPDVAHKDFSSNNIVFTTTSGGKWINHLAGETSKVLIGAWINFTRCVATILEHENHLEGVFIVPAGESNQPSKYNPEDWLVSLAIGQELCKKERRYQEPIIMTTHREKLVNDLDDGLITSSIYNSPNGKFLTRIGNEKDVKWAATKDKLLQVPISAETTREGYAIIKEH